MSTQTTCDRCGEVNPADIHTCTPPAAPGQEQFHVISHDCAERGCMAHDDRIDGPGVVIAQPALKPLTGEQIEEIYYLTVDYYSFARAIEAAHGIKGAA